MRVTDELVEHNAAYAAGFEKGGLPLPPARKVARRRCRPGARACA